MTGEKSLSKNLQESSSSNNSDKSNKKPSNEPDIMALKDDV